MVMILVKITGYAKIIMKDIAPDRVIILHVAIHNMIVYLMIHAILLELCKDSGGANPGHGMILYHLLQRMMQPVHGRIRIK
ncbi:hypothetical protein DRJ04_06905 [Candidatus Aerophobetes bacterium]|uniref:Uncharacterized protein n=1 Tax=Aerophobetes bacterium TaxID=2030807 RepID=A0A662DB19_UNCAE|nr:MAG: hypothetical protein DRJ04_06905 [Candidatus Aerophobetes bacterium]